MMQFTEEQRNSQPVYQFIVNNPDKDGCVEWADCNPDYFSKEPSDRRRILYTTPPVAAPAVPDGWKLVPVEPTAAMYDAGDQQLATKQVWDAMLAAAPEKPQ